MSNIQVLPVTKASSRRAFLLFPWQIYKDDPLWVPPLVSAREKTLHPARGPFFKYGQAELFIAWRDGKPVGTICAAEDPPTNERRGKKECIFGFFETIDDYQVAEALFDQAKSWAASRGLTALYGPFNLDYEDSYGILVEGRDRPPALMCGHSPAYYQGFVERYGFVPARANNVALEIDIHSPELSRIERVADKLRERGRIKIRSADLNNWDKEIDHVLRLLNTATAHLDDFIGWTRDQLSAMLEPFREIADPELVLFAEMDGEVVGFFPGIPNLNELFIHTNGLRFPWDMLKLLWYSRRQPECLAIKSVLVEPRYWNRGVVVLLADEMARRAKAKGYSWADLSITAEDNPGTIILAEHMGARIYKRWQVYRLDFG